MPVTLTPQETEYRARAEDAATTLYQKAGLPPPTCFIWFRSPLAMCRHIVAKRLLDGLHKVLFSSEYTLPQVPNYRTMPANWQFASRLPSALINELSREFTFIDANVCFFKEAIPFMEMNYNNSGDTMNERQREMLRTLRNAARTLDVVAPYADSCLMSDPPVIVHRDAQGRLHSRKTPAIVYSDGWKIYALEGLRVPDWYIEEPHKITPAEIDRCNNVAWRRLLVTLYQGDYYADCGATLESVDGTGRLYRKPRRNDSDFVFVRVTNSTREPDGTFREYVLRVPPKVKTPLEAVAWTFGMTPEEYLKTQKMT